MLVVRHQSATTALHAHAVRTAASDAPTRCIWLSQQGCLLCNNLPPIQNLLARSWGCSGRRGRESMLQSTSPTAANYQPNCRPCHHLGLGCIYPAIAPAPCKAQLELEPTAQSVSRHEVIPSCAAARTLHPPSPSPTECAAGRVSHCSGARQLRPLCSQLLHAHVHITLRDACVELGLSVQYSALQTCIRPGLCQFLTAFSSPLPRGHCITVYLLHTAQWQGLQRHVCTAH